MQKKTYGSNKGISIDDVRALAAKGKAQKEIADILGCSRQNIQQLAKAHHIPFKVDLRKVRRKKPRYCRICSTQLDPNRHQQVCSEACKRIAMHNRPRASVLTDKDIRTIRKLAASGTSTKELATQYDICRSFVYHIIQRRAYAYVQ